MNNSKFFKEQPEKTEFEYFDLWVENLNWSDYVKINENIQIESQDDEKNE